MKPFAVCCCKSCRSLTLSLAVLLNVALLEINRDRYIGTTCMYEKRAIVDEIVEHIVSLHGRFLKRVNNVDGSSKQWISISNDSARLKTAHAIQYRMRKKAKQSQTNTSQDMRTISTDDLEPISSNDTSLSTSGENEQTTMQCSDKCGRCERLEAHIRWILSEQGQPLWSGDEQPIGYISNHETTMESNGDRAGLVTPEAPPRAVKVRSDSLVSLEPLALSAAPPSHLNDLMATAVVENVIDPDWLVSNLSLNRDGKTDTWMDSIASFSSLSISF
jgi:hypothetical protein